VKTLGAIALCAVIAGCAAIEVTVPVHGKMAGAPVSGQATGRGDGKGVFWVDMPGGGRCHGEYDSLSKEHTFVVPAKCDDGRTGTITIIRNANLVGGKATAEISDGTRGQFVFGKDAKYEDEFPGPDATLPKAPPSRRAKSK
jgi:hypothetical protein